MARGINIAESVQKSYNNFSAKNKPVVFLSHKSEDKEYVESIGEYLMKAGIDIYLDKNDFNLQRAVKTEDPNKITECIQEGISKSDYILCFVSRNTVQSWWVPYEIGYGKKANKGISTLIRKNVEYIPDFLKIEDSIDSIDDINAYIKKITSNHYMPLNEQYSWQFETAEEHIRKSYNTHELSKYLHV